MVLTKIFLCVGVFSPIWGIVAAVVEKIHAIVVFLVLCTPMAC